MVATKSMMEVAVIGAGASGLVASRYLLSHGIRPTILESSHHIGGAWNSGDSSVGKMWNSLHTNLSKFTCSFSDHPHDPPNSSSSNNNNKDFVSHQEMHSYLESYSEAHVDPSCFRFGCHVTRVKPRDMISSSSSSNGSSRSITTGVGGYHVEWIE
jgi:dimethylaniline monooxygenase (N-oxide forming)